MEARPEETALAGGRTTPGVVRIGDTVRRPAKANSGFVRHLLAHLAAKGFELVPAHLGSDEVGREIFSFIEGEAPAELGFIDDRALRSAATLIRAYHDLSADLAEEVVCHNDLSPCNFVFRDGLPVAIIDFDAVSPGTRAHDLGYAAWLWLNFGSPEVSPSEQQRRLHLFVSTYGDIRSDTVLYSMMERQAMLIAEGRRTGKVAMAEWAEHCLDWTQRHAPDLV
jgi:Phosphotransferase enzyme family